MLAESLGRRPARGRAEDDLFAGVRERAAEPRRPSSTGSCGASATRWWSVPTTPPS